MQKWTDAIRIKLGFDQCFVVDCHGKSGGLMLLWKDSSPVEFKILAEDTLMLWFGASLMLLRGS